MLQSDIQISQLATFEIRDNSLHTSGKKRQEIINCFVNRRWILLLQMVRFELSSCVREKSDKSIRALKNYVHINNTILIRVRENKC